MTAAQVPPDSQTRGRVLVVEDEPHIRDWWRSICSSKAGRRWRPATGRRLAPCQGDPFDLVILDLMLPELDGITVCRAVRREA